jgi:hypothetical protein
VSIKFSSPNRTLSHKRQFAYYIPCVVVQAVVLIFIGTQMANMDFQLSPTPYADAISSVQALRITRNLWKVAQSQQSDRLLPSMQPSEQPSEQEEFKEAVCTFV